MTTQKSEEIKNEINQTTQRLNELTETQKRIADNLKVMQNGFIAGTITLDEMQIEQSKLTVLNDSIDALDARRAEMQAELDAVDALARRSDIVNQMAAAAAAAAKEFTEYARITDELNGILEKSSGELLDRVSGVIENKQKFRQLFLQIAPNGERSPEPGARLYLSAEILQELKQTGIDEESLRVATADALEDSDAEFSGVIRLVKEMTSSKRFALKQSQGVMIS
jgi:uncharacterized phage infection (PIP) family protein YhgE